MSIYKQFNVGIILLLTLVLTACGGGGGGQGKTSNSLLSSSTASSAMNSISQSTISLASSVNSNSSENNSSLISSSNESSVTQSETSSVSFQSGTSSSAANGVLSWGVATVIESTNADTGSPAIAVQENGDAIAIWQQSTAGNRTKIEFNRYTFGAGWATPAPIPIDELDSAINPVIETDKEGNAIAVWMQGTAPGISANLYMSRYTTTEGWSTPTRISNSGGFAYEHHLAMNAKGDAVLVWIQHDGVERSVYTSHFTIEEGWGTNTLAENSNFEVQDLAVAIDDDGNSTVVWVESDATSNGNLWANYSVASTGWGTATLIGTTAGNPNRPKAAMDSNGNAIVVWSQDGIWTNRYDVSSGWGTAIRLDDSATYNAFSPSIAMDSEGNAMVGWHETDDLINIPFSVLTRRYANGWRGAETSVQTDHTGDAQSPILAADANGNVIALWQQSEGTQATLWANRFTQENDWGTATLLETIDGGEAAYYSIDLDANGRAIAIWQQSDGSRNNIMVNHFSD